MSHQSFISGLLAKVQVYQQADYVARHVEAVYQFNRALTPTIDTLTSNSGIVSKLIVLRGTVPIEYRGGKYHIPVDIWLPESYPLQAPIVFVTPTAEMRVKPNHPTVDQSGHALIPYLRLWNATSSTLVELDSMLSVEFSNDPPVYRYNPKQVQPAAIAQGEQFVRHAGTSSPSHSNNQQSVLGQADHMVRERLVAFVKVHTEYVNGLIAHQFEQKNGSEAINQHIEKSQLQKEMLQKYLDQLKGKILEVEAWCQAHTPAEPPSTDELVEAVDKKVTPGDVWSRQLFEEAANDFSIEDALYALDKALQEDRIDLSAYLKKVRLLARDQFFSRAMCIKVESRQKALLMDSLNQVSIADSMKP